MSNLETRKPGWYGYIPDLPDLRDHQMQVKAPKVLPKTVTLEDNVGMQFPVYDQGDLGSCTANAIACAIEYQLRQQKLPAFTPSRLAIYYGERKIEGSIDSDSGAMIRDGMKVVAREGAADEHLWAYHTDESTFREQPSEAYYKEALKHQVLAYERVEQNERSIRQALAAGHPIVFGISVYESFESVAVERTGKVPMPKKDEAMMGGHAILMTGYTATTVHFRNSWGVGWGRNGHGTLPLDYVLNGDLAEDFWIIKLMEK
jgi:C1A family cysteine protease